MPTTGADNGLTLYDLRGADYDNERWDDLLDQMTVDEMVELIGWGGFQTDSSIAFSQKASGRERKVWIIVF